MTDLISKNCEPVLPDEYPFDENKITALLDQLNTQIKPQSDLQWLLSNDNKSIYCNYKFKNYYQTLAFVNVIAQIAHQQDHHPDISFSYNNCTVNYSTHSVDGLSINDFICAAKTNAAQNL